MLERWARWIQIWRAGGCPADAKVVANDTGSQSRARDVYCYFDNTDKVHAPANALRLLEMLDAPGHQRGETGATGRAQSRSSRRS
jgi:uncharacterized protein YecE (DUF72 family)